MHENVFGVLKQETSMSECNKNSNYKSQSSLLCDVCRNTSTQVAKTEDVIDASAYFQRFIALWITILSQNTEPFSGRSTNSTIRENKSSVKKIF